MAWNKKSRPKIEPPHNALRQWRDEYLTFLRVHNFTDQTVHQRTKCLGYFIQWAEQHGMETPLEITRPILQSYQRYLYYYRRATGQPLTFGTQRSRLSPVRQWYRWLTRNNYLPYNPAADLEMPRMEKRLPRSVFSLQEAERVLMQADVSDPLGLRNRAILETFYSTGMRRMELVQLKLYDVDCERGTVMIRLGKGKKDRVIPIGERAGAWVSKYVSEVRPSLAMEPDDMTVFLTYTGEPFVLEGMSELVRGYVNAAELGKTGSCHTFRHTMATLMLENGADIRFIQQMLGHQNLNTTEKYTHVVIDKLKKIHAATHPGALLEKEQKNPEPTAEPQPAPAAEELLAVLDAEAGEEE
jgi:integrase/recombinase XerD